MAKITFDNVSKRFDRDSLALKEFSLSIADGEFVVLVGPSGCGKSTALRLLAGIESVSAGEILIDDKVVNQATPQQRNIAMVFQNYALYPHMTVRDNLAFPLKMAASPVGEMNEKIEQIAELLDLGDLLARRPKQLSGGQRQRVAMGRALVRDPSVFLLDEPLSNLDARLRAQIRADIARLQQRLKKTTLYVTHDQVEAMTLGDRVAVMNRGELQQLGTPETLYAHPQNIFVAKFIGSPGMNIMPARLFNRGEQQFAIQFDAQTIDLNIADRPLGRDDIDAPGSPAYIGIRPESFRAAPVDDDIELVTEVVSVEYLGHESLVYFNLSNGTQASSEDVLVARLPGQFHHTAETRQKLFVHPEAIYLFDQQGQYLSGAEQAVRRLS